MKTSVGDRIVQRLQGFTEALENKEVIQERFTCRRIELNLNPTPYKPAKVKKTRKLLGASQAVFAKFIGVSLNTVRAWEQGINPPNNMACRLMDEIQRNPAYFIERLRECAVQKS
ncbi:hypothetical protein AYO40_03330 [Planctomycetaceae bacterium SCGC AG-212-D15]|nr:hypothetical protein AYO40_03330 [Planctomycetaceae bacterium SCGC AG-212-D15]